MVRKLSILLVFSILVTGLPLAGVYLSGKPVSLFVEFPPLTEPVGHAPFSWPVFLVCLFLAFATLVVMIAFSILKVSEKSTASSSKVRSFPWWGWLSLVAMLATWALAWSRLVWFESLQRYTFFPLWLSYIVLVNGLCFRQTGKCPMFARPLFFLFLFPLSAFFWWYFEYLNQFVKNWYYTGVDYGPMAYALHASISFSTVLPAVYSTREFIEKTEWFRKRFHGFSHFSWLEAPVFLFSTLFVSCVGLSVIGKWPEELFPIIWLAPLLILTSLQGIVGETTVFSPVTGGDWRPVVSAALAAVVCGFFWEMWNYYSLAKWAYSIPYVHGMQIFEMPVLGYWGYIPFGLECMAVVGMSESFGGCAGE